MAGFEPWSNRAEGPNRYLDTLRSVNETLISTVEEVRQIHREGMAARQNLASQIVNMRDDLQKRLAVSTSE